MTKLSSLGLFGFLALALPIPDSPKIHTMSDADLAQYKALCDQRTAFLMGQGDELRARWFALTRLSIVREQNRRKEAR